MKVFAAFEAAKPTVFTGFLDALSKAMKLYPAVKLERLPRMADFAKWGYAISEAIGFGGNDFIDLYNKNRNMINLNAIEENPVATAILELMSDKKEFNCTMRELLKELNKFTEKLEIDTKFNDWPKDASALSRKLTTIKSNLFDMGIIYNKHRNTQGVQVALNKIFKLPTC